MKSIFELVKYSILNRQCLFYVLTGFYCPGCGGTRAFFSLIHGHPLISVYYHPIVLYTLAVLVILAARYIKVNIYGENKNKILMPIWVLYVALFIIIGNCIYKNIQLIFYGVKMPLL